MNKHDNFTYSPTNEDIRHIAKQVFEEMNDEHKKDKEITNINLEKIAEVKYNNDCISDTDLNKIESVLKEAGFIIVRDKTYDTLEICIEEE